MTNSLFRLLGRSATAALVAFTITVPAQAQLIDFEGSALPCFVEQGYAGMNWGGGDGANSWVNATNSCTPQANLLQPVSGVNNAWSNGGVNLSMSSVGATTFTFSSVWMACANGSCGNMPTQAVRGFLQGSELFMATVGLTGTMTQFTFNFIGVDEVRWDRALPQVVNLLIDDININNAAVVPEPASVVLLGAGLIGLVAARRRRRSA